MFKSSFGERLLKIEGEGGIRGLFSPYIAGSIPDGVNGIFH